MSLPVLYGVTADAVTGEPITRVPRSVKISIGKPAGAALHVFIKNKKWNIEKGVGQDVTCEQFDIDQPNSDAQIKLVEKRYYELAKDAPKRNRPEKLNYFTFLRAAGDGTLVPDFETIRTHGPVPREIPIVFSSSAPLHQAFEYWQKSGLVCRGDGRDAMRSVDFPFGTPTEAQLEAKNAGKRTFPIYGGCWTGGCVYATPEIKNGKEYRRCAVHSKLSMQLAKSIRLGADAQYESTGFRTTSFLFSSLHDLMSFTGGEIRGLPLLLVMSPFVTKHQRPDGSVQTGKAYAVHVELRQDSVKALQAGLEEAAALLMGPRAKAKPDVAPVAKQIAPAPSTEEPVKEELIIDVEPEEDEEAIAARLAAEFGVTEGDEEETEEVKESLAQAQAALAQETEQKKGVKFSK